MLTQSTAQTTAPVRGRESPSTRLDTHQAKSELSAETSSPRPMPIPWARSTSLAARLKKITGGTRA